jgi:predicted Zn-dependent protease
MFIPGFMVRRKRFPGLLLLVLVALSPALLYAIERLSFKPGFNLFTPQQDVEVGQKSAAEVNKQLPLIRDAQVVGYINGLGKSLAKAAPAKPQKVDYEWTFNVVNSSDINAFALPGGFIYVNRGTIDAARNEAQIAGVIAHEEGHVVMRHGTHQASEMMLAQAPLAILGGLLGQSSSLGSQLAELGISFGVNSIFLRNSRSAESQADQVGTYILYHAGYDPYAMAQFFEIIQKKYPQQTIQFLSDHPNPGNRIRNVDQEIPLLGPKRDGKTDSPEFEAVKKRLESMPPAPPPPKSAR